MTWRRFLRQNPYLFALLLLTVLIIINASIQDNFFTLRAINGNFRVLLPLMILAVGQSLVIIGGGIDLSVGAMVSLVNAILVTMIMPESGVGGVAFAILVGCFAGMLAGAFNGLCVAYLRLQPIVTTYATSFIFAGLALLILPRPGGQLPRAMTRFYRSTPLEIPSRCVRHHRILLLIWALLRSSRYGQYLFATGSNADAAYTSGIPTALVKFSTYVGAGLLSAISALALTLGIGSGNPRIGDAMTLDSIVAVVLGGTRLSGGQGGIAGTIIGVAILGIIRSLISFANVPTWYQTLVNASIIVLALAGPGLWRLIRRPSMTLRSLKLNPALIALILAIALFFVGGLIRPGFVNVNQAVNILRLASLLGIVAAGQTLVIISGGEGIDLSVGAVVTLGAIMAFRFSNGQNELLILGLLAALLAGAIVGFHQRFGDCLLAYTTACYDTWGWRGWCKGLCWW